MISQDVLDHIYNATAVFQEIQRTLLPGGIHIFTVPTTSKQFPTFQAVSRVNQSTSSSSSTSKQSTIMLHTYPEIHGKLKIYS
jgi:predicted SAM-dependent methyltransferase